MNAERRRSLRQSLHSLVYFDLEPSNGGIVLDLSEGGMQISLAHPLVGAENVRFSLCIQPRKRIRGTGRIAWISSTGRSAGVHFLSLPEEAHRQILACLSAGAEAPAATAEVQATAEDVVAPGEAEVDEAALIAAAATAGMNLDEWDEEEDGVATATLDLNEATAASGVADEEPAADDLDDTLAGEQRNDEAVDAPKATTAPNLAKPSKHEPRPTPTPPPAWLEALIRTGSRYRDEDLLQRVEPWETATAPAGLGPGQTEPAEATGTGEAQTIAPRPPLDPSVALYLPNYEAEENRATGDVKLSRFHLKDSYDVAMKLAFERFEEFGWTLERDWHIWLALVLLIAGFLALAQKPPLPVLTGALWLASAVVAVKRKQRPRSAEPSGTSEPSEPDRQ